MTSPAPTYPKSRPAFYAHRYCRLLFLTRAASEIGPEAALICVDVAHTEDVMRYSGPVRIYANDLAARCGISVSTMERSRKRAVEAGWLHYEPGAKRRPALYWTTVPELVRDAPDCPTGEDVGDILRQPDGASGEHPGSIRGASGGELTDHLPSSLSLIPNPLLPASPAPSEQGTKTKKKTRTKTDPEADPRFVQFWEAYPIHEKKPAAAKAFAKINPPPELFAAMLSAIEAQKLSRKWVDGFITHPLNWLINRGWEDELPPAKTGGVNPPRPTTRTITSTELDPELYGPPTAGGGR